MKSPFSLKNNTKQKKLSKVAMMKETYQTIAILKANDPPEQKKTLKK